MAVNDFDLDGWPDILIANDSFSQQLFGNNRDGTFTEIVLKVGFAYDEDGKTFAGMGLDFDDYDNDGLPDVFTDALGNQKNALFRNAKGSFECGHIHYGSGRNHLATFGLEHESFRLRQ